MRLSRAAFILPCFVLLFCASCGGADDLAEFVNDTINDSSTIPDEWEADYVAQDIDDMVTGIDLPSTSTSTSTTTSASKASSFSRTYTDEVISGTTGTVTINGTNVRDYSSTSSSVSDTHTIDVTLEFSNYSDGGDLTMTGTVSYYEYHHSYQSGASSYSSSFSKSITSDNAHIVCPMSDSEGTIVDDVSFNISDKDGNQYSIEGNITNGNGETFSF